MRAPHREEAWLRPRMCSCGCPVPVLMVGSRTEMAAQALIAEEIRTGVMDDHGAGHAAGQLVAVGHRG